MKYVKNYRSLIIAIIIGVIGALTAIGMFSLSGLMLSKSAFDVPLYTLMVLVACIKLFGVVRAVARYFERLISHEATFEMLKDLRTETFAALARDFTNLQSKYKLSELLARVVSDIEKLQNLLLRVIYPPAVILLTSITVIVIYIRFSFIAMLAIAIFMTVILFVLPFTVSRQMQRLTTRTAAAEAVWLSSLSDYELGREDIKVFDTHQSYDARMTDAKYAYEQAIFNEKKAQTRYDFMLNFFSMLAICSVIIGAAGGNPLMYASLVMVTITLFEMAVQMTNFPFYHQDTKQAMQRLDNLEHIEITSKQKVDDVLPIELKNLHFSYDEYEVLRGIDLTIEQGKSYAIVGMSGSGKSTLLKILAGLYVTDMIAGGQPYAALDSDSYYSKINVMMQHNHFMEGTIADNLFSTDEVKMQQLLDELQLPFKPSTEIGEFGKELSGGEKKRLHFIRMMLRDKALWLLDEPFNGVDTLNIARMLQMLHHPDRTIVMISHELGILQNFDEILVMQDGMIAERGSYNALMAQKGMFHHLVTLEETRI